jgi:hypothetical protein
LSAQHADLGFILGILKQHQIMSIQTDGPRLGCSIEKILCDVNETGISMVRFVRKPIYDGFYGFTAHHVVKKEKIRGTQIGH